MKVVHEYGRTAWVAGHPIEHTLSPAIHNSAFEREDLPHRYFAVDVKPDELARFLELFDALDGLGMNFTLPLKEEVCHLIDRKTEAVERLGAANTLFRDDGELTLDNTDVHGFTRLIEPWHDHVNSRPVLVLGAGGAARACVFALAEIGCPRIEVWNRTRERARSLKDEFTGVSIDLLSDSQLAEGDFESDLVVNATSLGLDESDPSPLPKMAIDQDTIGVDLIYNRDTAFMDTVANRGRESVGGLKMLVYQAAKAWEHWVGFQPDVETMMDVARGRLRSS